MSLRKLAIVATLAVVAFTFEPVGAQSRISPNPNSNEVFILYGVVDKEKELTTFYYNKVTLSKLPEFNGDHAYKAYFCTANTDRQTAVFSLFKHKTRKVTEYIFVGSLFDIRNGKEVLSFRSSVAEEHLLSKNQPEDRLDRLFEVETESNNFVYSVEMESHDFISIQPNSITIKMSCEIK